MPDYHCTQIDSLQIDNGSLVKYVNPLSKLFIECWSLIAESFRGIEQGK